jgi:phenylalanyl-tRNA synthetase beta chain
MKASISWLKSLCPTERSAAQIVSDLTMAGLEVDAIEPAAHPFTQVVIGQITDMSPHPNADKLNVCQVSDGQSSYQVVCGAANARPGLKAPFAQVGGSVGPEFQIQEAELRGVTSSGMLCGADELGLSDERDGLMELPDDAPVGMDFKTYLDLPDSVIEVDLTPNRGDCLSVTGLARELAVLTQTTFAPVACQPVVAVHGETLPVTLSAKAACPCYVGRVITDIDVSAVTPTWMVERLRRSGIRSIDAIVDITNYVMLELGQPMHAFDLERLDTGIEVRFARDGETLTLLDGKVLSLTPDVLVIADQAKALALAGIMGGEDSGISKDTRNVFLESAFFDPVTIAGKARRFGLHTDASARFERGVDWALAEAASERATQLMLDICGGKAGPVHVTEARDAMPTQAQVHLTDARIAQQLKIDLEPAQIQTMLEALGFVVSRVESGFECIAPSWRFDIEIEQDLIEEIARIYGYNRLPTSLPVQALSMAEVPEATTPLTRLKAYLVDGGLNEVITYSFVDPALQSQVGDGMVGVRLANPIASNMAEMRRSLIPGLVETVRHNVNRQHHRVHCFETGQCFIEGKSELDQSERLGVALYGDHQHAHFSGQRSVDFYDLKGLIEGVASLSGGTPLEWTVAEHPAMAPGQTAAVSRDGQLLGHVGRLHPRLAREMDLARPLYLADLELAPLLSGQVTAFKPISRYPRVSRDIAIVVEERVSWSDVCHVVSTLEDARIRDMQLFDVYRGTGIEPGFQSLAISLSLQYADGTLDETSIQQIMDQVVDALKAQLHAELRG